MTIENTQRMNTTPFPRSTGNVLTFLALGIGSVALVLVAVMFFWGNQQKRIAVVRSNAIIHGYTAMKDAQERYDNKQKAWHTSVATLENELQTEVESFRAVYASLSKEEMQKREQTLEQKRSHYVQYTQALQEKAAKEEQDMMQSVFNQINSFVEEYGRQHGYDIILGTTSAGNVLYGTPSVDITDDVLKALNNSYSTNNSGGSSAAQ